MALSKSLSEEIPKDGVEITAEKALSFQWKIIKSWKDTKEVWALRHSVTVGVVMSALTGLYVNTYYRRKMRLGRYGHMSTYLPIVVIPSIFSVITHKFFVQRNVILDPLRQCPLCLQLHAAAFQVSTGVLYPVLLAPFATFMYATRHCTYKIPSITEKPLEVFEVWRKITKPIFPTICGIVAAQAFITMFLTYKQIDQSVHLILTMRKAEQQFEEENAKAESTF